MSVNINALDDMDSLLWANHTGESRGFAYSPFGSTDTRGGGDSLLSGFNGERLDPVSQSYNLGNGYRTYNPTLMRFNAPDSWSPFGSGGPNQYAYCEGDPINRSDPSGHMSSGAAMGIGIGMGILGLLGAVFTFGQSIAAAAAAEAALTASMAADLLATGLGVAASVTNIASASTQESNPEASRILGWVSFGLGIASFATHTTNFIESKFKGRFGSYDLSDGGSTARKGGAVTINNSTSEESGLGRPLGSYLRIYEGSIADESGVKGKLIVSTHAIRGSAAGDGRLPKNTAARYFCLDGEILHNAPLAYACNDSLVDLALLHKSNLKAKGLQW